MRTLTKEQVEVVLAAGKAPYVEPTEVVLVPTDTEMAEWYPDPAPEKIRWRTEHNVSTGEVTHYELTLEEYRARHVAKIKARNEFVLRKRREKVKADRDATLARLIDALEADPTLLDKIKGS